MATILISAIIKIRLSYGDSFLLPMLIRFPTSEIIIMDNLLHGLETGDIWCSIPSCNFRNFIMYVIVFYDILYKMVEWSNCFSTVFLVILFHEI